MGRTGKKKASGVHTEAQVISGRKKDKLPSTINVSMAGIITTSNFNKLPTSHFGIFCKWEVFFFFF
jgi:hypothetical protein